jgi:hypothetical protein
MGVASRALWAASASGLLLLLASGRLLASSLIDSNPAGCAAVNAGALDLAVKIEASGLRTGLMGSGFVDGFAEGDVLTFTQEVRSGSNTFLHRLSLAAFDRYGSHQMSTVFFVGDQVLAAGEQRSKVGTRYVIPTSATGWALFTSSLGEGEGDYTITVRCEPATLSSAKPVS